VIEKSHSSDELVASIFRDAGMEQPTADDIASARKFVDEHMAIPVDIWSIDSDELRDWRDACQASGFELD